MSNYIYRRRVGEALENGALFSAPVHLILLAQKSRGRDRELLRVALAAGASTPDQEAELFDLAKRYPGEVPLWDLPEDLVGISIGVRWFPAGAEVLEPIFDGTFARRGASWPKMCWTRRAIRSAGADGRPRPPSRLVGRRPRRPQSGTRPRVELATP